MYDAHSFRRQDCRGIVSITMTYLHTWHDFFICAAWLAYLQFTIPSFTIPSSIRRCRVQHSATHCHQQQPTAIPCNSLQHTTTLCNISAVHAQLVGNTEEESATHCNTLPTHCITMQPIYDSHSPRRSDGRYLDPTCLLPMLLLPLHQIQPRPERRRVYICTCVNIQI